MIAAAPAPQSQVLRLREYQEDMVERVRDSMRRHRRVLLQLPTGGGKTAIASYMTQGTVANGRLVNFNCHRSELVEQTSRTWRKYGIAHGFIAAGRPKILQLANVCSIDTLKNRLMTTAHPNLAIWDEAHHLGAAGWQRVMDAWDRTRHIGLSATPWRSDGTGLCHQFDDMVEGPSPAWLMDNGFLSRYEIFAPNVPDMTGVKRERGDFAKDDASKRMDIPKRFGDILTHWRRHAFGMRTIAFAVNVADSRMIVAKFNAAGISAAHLDADTPKEDREEIIRAFAAGEILVLSNVALFGEGFDLSAIAQTEVTIDCLIDAAPTQSLAAVLQRWGRVLRPKDYPAIILDHAGNSNRHGFPDDEREWSLADRERTGKGGSANDGPPPPFTCKCFRQIRRPLPDACPHCGVSLVPDVKPVDEGEGELTQITAAEKAAIRARLKREEHEAKTISELADLARRRGYKNPSTWAFKKWSNSPERQRYARRQAESLTASA